MIPYGRQSISAEDIDAVVDVLRSEFLTQGPKVPKFEDAISEYCSAKYAVAVNSATSALHIACMALGVGKNDWVWTSPNTFVASANCAIYCGAKIDFVDIDPKTYNISIDALADKLKYAATVGRLPKVVIPVHFAGQSADMSSINNLAKLYGFKIIEDASHAIGARYKNIPVGACAFSDITVFSFHPVKIITSGEGGIATTNDKFLAENLRRLRSHGITSDPIHMLSRPSDEIWNYQQISLGFNYRLTEMQAALGLSQIKRLDEFVIKRNEVADFYNSRLHELPVIRPYQGEYVYSSYHLYPIRIPCSGGVSQKTVYEFLRENGVGANLHYIPVYRHPFFERYGFQQGYCPEVEQFFNEVISLPIYPDFTKTQQNYVIDVLKAATLK